MTKCEYAHSTVSPPGKVDINAHMQKWADDDWELVNGSIAVDGGGYTVYAFFWRRHVG